MRDHNVSPKGVVIYRGWRSGISGEIAMVGCVPVPPPCAVPPHTMLSKLWSWSLIKRCAESSFSYLPWTLKSLIQLIFHWSYWYVCCVQGSEGKRGLTDKICLNGRGDQRGDTKRNKRQDVNTISKNAVIHFDALDWNSLDKGIVDSWTLLWL